MKPDVTILKAEHPFTWSDDDREFSFGVKGRGVAINGCLYVPGVIASLLEDECECDIVTCGCGIAGCAGFFEERFHKTPESVVWAMRYRDRHYKIVFNRCEYESEALRVLRHMVENNVGWNDFSFELYQSFDEFVAEVKKAETACGC